MDGIMTATQSKHTLDLATLSLRAVNQYLHHQVQPGDQVDIYHPNGAHNVAVGLQEAIAVDIHGHTGYYAAGMNQQAQVTIHGNAGAGVAENMMSGRVQVKGFASVSAGASAHGGLLVIDGDAGLRCGISLKGADIVVGGSVGSFSAFMAQAGRMVICGDAGDALGDSLYEAVLYVRGTIKSLGADAQLEPMTEGDRATVADLLTQAGLDYNPKDFKRVASARNLYHWNADAEQEY
jgi:glutamate synthase domain-containing protein 3